jgi:alkylated DNA nucleotide flippase Atl1
MVLGVPDEVVRRVRAVIARIPAGRVVTYGDVAGLAEAPSAQVIGQVLSLEGADLPWQRVLHANGTCSPHLRNEQLALLQAEGVSSVDGKVDLRGYRWDAAIPAPVDESQLGLF